MRLCIAERAWDEAQHELRRRVGFIAEKRGIARTDLSYMLAEALHLAALKVAMVPAGVYEPSLETAVRRIPRDADDAPSVALALAFGGDACRCAIWTNDGDYLGCGVPVWTTGTLLEELER